MISDKEWHITPQKTIRFSTHFNLKSITLLSLETKKVICRNAKKSTDDLLTAITYNFNIPAVYPKVPAKREKFEVRK